MRDLRFFMNSFDSLVVSSGGLALIQYKTHVFERGNKKEFRIPIHGSHYFLCESRISIFS